MSTPNLATDGDVARFIDRQRKLLQKERDAVIEQSTLLLSSCSAKLLEQRGLALLNLGVVNVRIGLGGKTLVELERPAAHASSPVFPSHTFRPGDLARIDEQTATAPKAGAKASKKLSDTKDAKEIEGVVYKVSDTRIIIAVDSERNGSQELELPSRCKLVKIANTVTFDRMDRAIDTLEKHMKGTAAPTPQSAGHPGMPFSNRDLIRVLMNQQRPGQPTPVADLQFMDPSLNPSQQQAVRFALEAAEVACIHGPPGTGKTHTLVEIVRQLVSRDKSVLICGASNLAVDNLLERLLPHRIPLTRIGHPARVMEALHTATLDAQTARSEQYALANDVKKDIESAMGALTGKGKGKLKGPERRKMWEEVRELRKEYRKREGAVVSSVVKQAKVVLATCHGAGGRQLYDRTFDVVIIDEATQALEAVSWIPIFKGAKLILAGDPCQLPPTVISANERTKKKAGGKVSEKKTVAGNKSTTKPTAAGKKKPNPAPVVPAPTPEEEPIEPPASESESDDESDNDDDDDGSTTATPAPPQKPPAQKKKTTATLRPSKTLQVTLFDRLERLYGPGIKRMLTVQYRMHAQIASFPSKTLYHSALVSHESVRAHRLRDFPATTTGAEEVLDVPVVFFDTAGCEYFERLEGDADGGSGGKGVEEGSRCNENEAVVVKMWVEKLVEAGVLPSQIAIITPYQAQVTLLSSLLRPSMPELEIGSVDGMQGREKEAVVLSLVRSNDKREVGFLKDKRRLNVAMTRARRHLCVVGDSSTIQHGGKYLKNWMAWLEANADVRYAGPE
ncbi:P-loop containing nucleoside triphosphate hydrolase protein [Exidia glandulosa HHB12029]|uniref:DNA helicase n=1 Tax=Exidia glandulosa HHB12029 TaxID=1314781 RepID=A0A165EVI0_EXIGL|nr:P-loop containing nucleoside triphosphate hydrolase protein [Exidia glandulosa HHB12029]